MSVSQDVFGSALLDPQRPTPEGLIDPDGRPAGKRFDVYRNTVTASLASALEEAFPAVRSLVGQENFRVLAIQFLRTHPPTSPLLATYGADMPAFLARFEHTSSVPYLPDVAHLEQALRRSYHAADVAAADMAPLAQLSPQDVAATRVTLAPALQLVRSRWPLAQIYDFALGRGPKPQPQPQDVLVTRPGFDPMPQALPPGAGPAIEALRSGCSLGRAAEITSVDTPDFDLSETLSLLIAGQAIIALHPPTA